MILANRIITEQFGTIKLALIQIEFLLKSENSINYILRGKG